MLRHERDYRNVFDRLDLFQAHLILQKVQEVNVSLSLEAEHSTYDHHLCHCTLLHMRELEDITLSTA